MMIATCRVINQQPNTASRVLCLLLLLCFATIFPALAQDEAPEAPPVENQSPAEETATPTAPVQINDRVVFEVIGASGVDAQARAERINRRLQLLIERVENVEPFRLSDIVGTGSELTVMLGGEEIITVTQADVEHELTPARELAQRWGEKLSRQVRAARFARTGTVNNIAVLTATSMYDLIRSVIMWLPRLLGALILFLVFWGLAWITRWIMQRAMNRAHLDPNLSQLGVAVAFYGVWALGFLAILSTLGIDSASIATTVGVSGFVLGFAFRDVLAHFFAGLMLLMGRQFSIGGQIVVGEFEGTVENISLRALQLRTFDNRLVTIPNGDVFNSAVIANTHNIYRRRDFTVRISYDDDPRRATDLALQTVRGVEGVLSEPPPQVVVEAFGISSVDLRVYFYVSTAHPDPLGVVSECIIRVKERFEAEKITIPFQTHIVDVRRVDGLGEAVQPVLDALQSPVDKEPQETETGKS